MPCFRTPYPTLQSVFRHHPCVIVVVGDQGLAVEQVIGTQTDGICFLAVLALTVRLLFLGFAPFTRHDGNNGCMYVRSLLVHVQMCGNHIVFAECGLQPLDAVAAPFIEFSFFLYVHHVLVCTRQDHPNDTDLVVRDFPSDACRVQPVGNRFIPAVNAIGVFDKYPVQMRSCRVCVFRYYLSLYMVGLRGVRCTLCFLYV